MQAYDHTIGPAIVLLSATDATAGSGAGWTFVGPTYGDTVVRFNVEKSYGGNDIVGNIGLAGATYAVGVNPEVTLNLLDETKARIAALLGAVATTSGGGGAIGLNAGLIKMVEPMMAIIPIEEVNELIAASSSDWVSCANGIWLQAVDLTDFGPITRGLPPGGQFNMKPRPTTFRGLFRETTRSGETTGSSLAIDSGAQILWVGDPGEWVGTCAVWSAAVNLPDCSALLP